jgi:2-polyprenyl-3-methyl-5-hydroxy-6-metoxy-1,4-benzoquinol methylase
LKSKNPIRSWFHKKRIKILKTLVYAYYSQDKLLVDLGCASCVWNVDKLPVIGVDINGDSMKYATKEGRLKKYQIRDIRSTDFANNSIDIIVCSEVLEHIKDHNAVIQEIHRILKPKGILILSVPYDTLFSLWRPLFSINCFIEGYILGNSYSRHHAGHINHFSPRDIKKTLTASHLKILYQFHLKRISIFTVASKEKY